MRNYPLTVGLTTFGLTTLLGFGCGSPALGKQMPAASGALTPDIALASADASGASSGLLLPVDKRPKAPGFDGATAWLNT